MELKACRDRSIKIREQYHQLEERFHGSRWTVEEDTLAFLTDAGLVGRLTMATQGRWPSEEKDRLAAKIGECVWWLAVLSQRQDLDFAACVEQFLEEKEKELKE